MKITLDELKIILNHIIEELKLVGHGEVELKGDYYWLLDDDDRENFDKVPTDFLVGSLIDDWTELQKVKDRTFGTLVDMERLAHICLAIVAEISKQNCEHT